MNFNSFKEMIETAAKEAKRVLIFSHVNPDGDTLGTMCAMYSALKDNFNLEADMVYNGIVPEIYKFLPYIELAKKPSQLGETVYDIAIAVDIAAKDRMGDSLPYFEKAKHTVNFDHHKTNTNFAATNFVQAEGACAGEVLLEFLESSGLKISKDTAYGLYTALLTDTGGFRYENTKAETLKKASRLIEYGAEPAAISRFCYESKPRNMVLLHANCMINAKFYDDNKIAGVCITNKDMEKFNAKNDYTEGIVEELRRIDTTQVSFVLKEVDENTTKASLRSKNTDVSIVAQAFGGGGHTFAAGCTIRKPLQIANDKILDEIRKVMK